MNYQFLSKLLGNISGIEAIWLVSSKRKMSIRSIDLLACCKNGHIENYAGQIIQQLRKKWPIGNFYVYDDSVRFSIPKINGGIAVYDTVNLKKKITEWINGKGLNGEKRSWAIAYWVPEALCGDIVTAKLLHDPQEIHALMCKILSPYPPSLSEAICDFCRDELDRKIKNLRSLKRQQRIEIVLVLSDINASVVRFAFARSKIYLRGFNDILLQAKNLTIADKKLALFAHQFSNIDIKQKKLESFLADVEKTVTLY